MLWKWRGPCLMAAWLRRMLYLARHAPSSCGRGDFRHPAPGETPLRRGPGAEQGRPRDLPNHARRLVEAKGVVPVADMTDVFATPIARRAFPSIGILRRRSSSNSQSSSSSLWTRRMRRHRRCDASTPPTLASSPMRGSKKTNNANKA